ncbi:MAG TPA: PKD domain-containing protein, partial [Bacteroidia bacterium]|nr:PKD domain-containing protein [Bacteroidia bacterium]
MKKFLLFILAVFSTQINAQQGRLPTQQELAIKYSLQNQYTSGAKNTQPNHLMITGPEQDCAGAIAVCAQSYTQTGTYTGHGNTQEVVGACLLSGESNSVWYTFTIQNSGTFTFLLNTVNDYDFALYDITNTGCANVPTATPVRCNYSATYGNTGLTLPTSTTSPLSVAASGTPTEPGLNVTTGQTFALIIDNYSANTNGYTLTFGGTAQLSGQATPFIQSTGNVCNTNTIAINFSNPIKCSSINPSGNQFTVTAPTGTVPVIAADNNCAAGTNYKTTTTLTYDTSGLTPGVYTVSTTGGFTNICGTPMPPQTFTFQSQWSGPVSIASTHTSVCVGGTVTLTASGANTYTWSTNDTGRTVAVSPTITHVYTVTGAIGTCTAITTTTITTNQVPVVTYTIMQNAAPQTWDLYYTIMGGTPPYNYLWTWGDGTTSNTAYPSHIYSVAGRYSISLIVGDTNNCSGIFVQSDSLYRYANSTSSSMVYVNVYNGNQTTHVNQNTLNNLIKIYPNPAQNKITIDANNL